MIDVLTALEGSAFSTWLRESTSIWAYPTVLTLHTVGLAMLVGLNAAIDLRVLGFGTGIDLAWLKKLFPAMWIGFWVNFVTGAMLFATDPIVKGMTALFAFKLGLVIVGVTLIVALRRRMYDGARPAPVVTGAAKGLALLSLMVWLAALAAGRFMAYV